MTGMIVVVEEGVGKNIAAGGRFPKEFRCREGASVYRE